jgi:hypothetical protein
MTGRGDFVLMLDMVKALVRGTVHGCEQLQRLSLLAVRKNWRAQWFEFGSRFKQPAEVDAIISQMGERIGRGGGGDREHRFVTAETLLKLVRGAQEIDDRHQATEDIERARVLASRRRAAAA